MKYTIPNTNVCISATLKDGGAFAGVPVTSLNCYGTCHRIPRVTSTISINSHFRNRDFVRFCCIFSITQTGGAGPIVVSITNPVTVAGSSGNIVTNCCLVFDGSDLSTISLNTENCDVATFPNLCFRRWEDSLGNTLSTDKSTAFILSGINSNSAWIRAVWNNCEDGGGSGGS